MPPGYLPINRKLFENPLWTERRTFSRAEAWLDLVQMAKWSDDPGKYFSGINTVQYYRGELIASLRYLEQRWRWPMTTVHRFLDFLEREGMITRRLVFRQSIISLVNYCTYNGGASNPTGNAVDEKAEKNGTQNGTQNGTPETLKDNTVTEDSGTPNETPNGNIAETGRNNIQESKTEGNEEYRIGEEPKAPVTSADEVVFNDFTAWVNKNAPTVNSMKEPFTLAQYSRIRSRYKKELVQELILAMHNHTDLLKKYRSANLTLQNWANRRLGDNRPPASAKKKVSDEIITAREVIQNQN